MVLTDAQATLEAARITAEATRWAGWISGGLGLVGGLLVVLGAFKVGKAQVKTQDKQNKILEKQDEILRASFQLERAKLKFDLFDRRFEIYINTYDFLELIILKFVMIKNGNENLSQSEFHYYILNNVISFWNSTRRAIFLFEGDEFDVKLKNIFDILDLIKNSKGNYDINSNDMDKVYNLLLEEHKNLASLFIDYLVVENITI